MDTTLKTLKRFCDTDAISWFLSRPFLYELNGKTVACATNSHLLCIAKNGCGYVKSSEYKAPNVASVIPADECTETLSVSRLSEALAKVPKTRNIVCPECNGKGQVNYQYYNQSANEKVYHEFDCPHCNGTGAVDGKNGKLRYDDSYHIIIGGADFRPSYLKVLIEALVGREYTEVCYCVVNKYLKIENEQFIMLLLGDTKDYKHAIIL